MKLSKSFLYTGIISYSIALAALQDMPANTGATGTMSLAFLAKIGLDVIFVCMAAIRLLGDGLFAYDEEGDDAAVTKEDLSFSDTFLYGLFFVNILANMGFHAYMNTVTTGAESFYYMIWSVGEFFGLFLTGTLWKHAAKAQRRAAKRARDAAAANGKVANINSNAA